MSAVRIGVLGCADIAWRRALPAFTAADEVTLTAIASRDGARARRFAEEFGGDAVTGYQELLERDDVDAVYLPLPAMLHAEWIERALLAGKHVFAEKPLTANLRQAERAFGLAAERNLVLVENFMFLHHSQHERVRQLIALDAIGELRSFASTFTIPPKPTGDMRYLPEVGGGALIEIGGYPLRAATHFLGFDIAVVGAHLRVDPKRDNVVLSGDVLLCTPTGVTAQLSFGMEHAYRTSYEFAGSRGRLVSERVFTPPSGHQPVVRVLRQDHAEEFTLPADDQWLAAVRAFAKAVANGGCDGADSLRHAALVDQVAEKAVRTSISGGRS